MGAKIWEEEVTIPTYKVFPPEKNPLFIEKRAYQGSTGKVYPLPVTEKISDEKTDQVYKAVFLENEYLKVMVLPELGGRIQRAYDKTNGYDFVYYNEVIKPALVGLTGPWISGGIEFNWPQHHRPSTYAPQDYTIKEHADGSVTVYVGEIDRMYGTKGEAAISLYPGKAYIEIRGQLYNHTEMPQTFLWWANPAVSVNDNTYSVFPPDVNAVMDHGKRAVSTFPIATGEYYKQDYSAGVDISRYKNVKVPTSYMAAHSDFDFIGNYDEGVDAGLLHVADHHVSPGKKQWTWGNGDFGRMWDKNLTDENGPYIELMTGVFCDNQPDFTWLKPHEEKNFVQYFMPYKGVGRVSNATKDCAVGFSLSGKEGILKVYATGKYEGAEVIVKQDENIIFSKTTNLSPETCLVEKVETEGNIEKIWVEVRYKNRTLVKYKGYDAKPQEIPKPAEPMLAPVDVKTNEDLWLCGMHLEQYRHATREPADYYEEGLRRDPRDIRINNSYGLLLFRRGQIEEGIPYFKKAIEHLTNKNPNPYYGESYFNLGLAYHMLGKNDEAFDAFYKATWSAETQSNAFYWLAVLSCRGKDYTQALDFVENCLNKNLHDLKARGLCLAIMRQLGENTRNYLYECVKIDPIFSGFAYEQYLSDGDLKKFLNVIREEPHNYLELSLNYIHAGFYEDALKLLRLCPDQNLMVRYYEAYVEKCLNKNSEAIEKIECAEALSVDMIFPNRLEEMVILKSVLELKDSPKANLLLGNLLYDKKQYRQASGCWKKAESLPQACRNLAIYYYNKEQDGETAEKMMARAIALDSSYPRYYLEQDQLFARLGKPESERLQVLEANDQAVKERDDLFLRYIALENAIGRYEKAYADIMSRRFHPWEGGEGKASKEYKRSLIEMAKQAIASDDNAKALEYLNKALIYPDNLGEGKLPNVPDNEIHYYMGVAYRNQKDEENATKFFELATVGSMEPAPVLYYNDQPSDYIYFIGLAYRAIGNEPKALKAFNQLKAYGQRHIFDKVDYDFFAVSLPEIEVFQEDIQARNENYCNYLTTLGQAGLSQ